ATWKPQYRMRAAADNEPVRLEYLAAVSQQTGEDWGDVRVTLSTAQPALNAAPPDLLPLAISVGPADETGKAFVGNPGAGKTMGGMGGMGMGGMGGGGAAAPGAVPATGLSLEQYAATARSYRGQAQTVLNRNEAQKGNELLNTAAALDQAAELLAKDDDEKSKAEANGGVER